MHYNQLQHFGSMFLFTKIKPGRFTQIYFSIFKRPFLSVEPNQDPNFMLNLPLIYEDLQCFIEPNISHVLLSKFIRFSIPLTKYFFVIVCCENSAPFKNWLKLITMAMYKHK